MGMQQQLSEKKNTHKYQHIIVYRSEKVNALLYDASPCVRIDVILLERLFQLIPHRILNIHWSDLDNNLDVL